MKRIFFFLIAVFVLFGFTVPVQAFEMRQGNDITVGKDTTITGSLVAGGKNVTIDGTVNGDVYCGAQSLTISGTVNGDVICGAQTISVTGTIAGSLRTASQLLDITGRISRNVTSVGQTISLNAPAIIAGELISAGQTIHINNAISGDVTAAGQTIALGEKTRIMGNFTYMSPNTMSQTTGAVIAGKLTHQIPPKNGNQVMRARNWIPHGTPWPVNAIGSIILYLIVGVIVVSVAGDKVTGIVSQMLLRPWFDIFIGFLTMIVAPILIILFAITIIGIPIAIIFAVIFILMIVLARIYVSAIVGEKILTAIGKTKTGLVLRVLAGVILVQLLAKLPIFGWVVSLFASFWGLGGLLLSFGKRK